MPVYYFWGEDEFALRQAAEKLRDRSLDPAWASFNSERIPPEQSDSVLAALSLALTPPFGSGQRFIWLPETTLAQQCSDAVYAELARTLPQIPETTVLLFSSTGKPNGRLKSTKLLQKVAELKEFSPIPPWRGEALEQQVAQVAQEVGVRLDREAIACLAAAVGNQTRQLYSELEKLKLYQADRPEPVTARVVHALVSTTTQNSLQLAAAIRQGDCDRALSLVSELIASNEPALRISATLIGQFRMWLWVKLLQERGERDPQAIATAAGIGNPKRVHFVVQEVRSLSSRQLQQTLPLLLDLELGLKQGVDPLAHLQSQVVALCQCCQPPRSRP
ncbi:DNA polymerase III subunit delta [Synechococcus elongatus IITB7]|uniref:DNA polymerase III subunit delta n=1 Tax=Synechococcus elongatus TaxID=32046 RepID=UPI0030CE52B3